MPIIIIVLVLIILIAGIVLAKNLNNNGPKATPTPTPEDEQAIEKLPADALDVAFKTRYDNKAFTITLKGLKDQGYRTFEYEISYDAQSPEDLSQIITQGSASKEPVAVSNKDFIREILLGTCSKNICKYDQGVKSVKITLRLTTTVSKIKIWEKEFPLE